MKPTTDGLYRDVSRENYNRIDRVNWSTLRHMKKSPKHYRANLTQKVQEDTDAMRLGRAVHVAALEPERFRAQYVVWDGGRRYGKEWDKFQAQHEGLEILTEDQYELVQAITDAALSDAHAAKYLRGGAAEVSMLWTHHQEADAPLPAITIECKGRLDFAADFGALVDLKTTRDASPEAFARAAYNMDFCAQLAMYQDGYAATNAGVVLPCVLVAVENQFPFAVQVYRVPDALIERGRETYRDLLLTLAACRFTNAYPGYSDGELELDLPRWARPMGDDLSALDLEVENANA